MRILALTDAYLNGFVLDHFRSCVIEALRGIAHDLHLVTANRFVDPGTARFYSVDQRQAFMDEVEQGPWDLIFTFNRAGMVPGLPFVEDRTPVLTWYLDSPQRVPAPLRQHKPSEQVFISDHAYLERLGSAPGLSRERVHYQPFCTSEAFLAQGALPQEREAEYAAEISFVGTYFSMRPLGSLLGRVNARTAARLFAIFDDHQQDYQRPMAELIEKHALDLSASILGAESLDVAAYLLRAIDDFRSAQVRVDYLSAVADLGLKLYGNSEWSEVAQRNFDLLRCFQFREAGPQELPSIYRASKVLLNICHVQARSGVPFRVFDVIGCGAFLLSEHRDDLARLFELDQELVTFRSPGELREKARYYLVHEEERRRIAERGRRKVLAEHTASHRARSMLAALGAS